MPGDVVVAELGSFLSTSAGLDSSLKRARVRTTGHLTPIGGSWAPKAARGFSAAGETSAGKMARRADGELC